MFFSLPGKNVLFVNSFPMTKEFFDKRSANFSDRNTSVMLEELYVLATNFLSKVTHVFPKNGLGFQFWPYAIRWVILVG